MIQSIKIFTEITWIAKVLFWNLTYNLLGWKDLIKLGKVRNIVLIQWQIKWYTITIYALSIRNACRQKMDRLSRKTYNWQKGYLKRIFFLKIDECWFWGAKGSIFAAKVPWHGSSILILRYLRWCYLACCHLIWTCCFLKFLLRCSLCFSWLQCFFCCRYLL